MATTRTRDPEDLLPEELLLFALAKLQPSPADAARAAALVDDPRFSWDKAWALAAGHWVHGLLAFSLENHPDLLARMPRELRPVMGLSRLAAKRREAMYAEAAGPALAELARAGVRVSLMKGAAMLSLFPPGTRLLNDLDVLIDASDLGRVAAAIEACGFRRVPPAWKVAAPEREHRNHAPEHEASFVKRSNQAMLSVDVHWLMYGPDQPFPLDTASLLSRARPAQFASAPVLAL